MLNFKSGRWRKSACRLYCLKDIVLSRTDTEYSVELDTVLIDGVETKLYGTIAYMPDHYKNHKKFLKSYYEGNYHSALFFAKQLELDGPPEMRNYYISMANMISSKEPPIHTPEVNN